MFFGESLDILYQIGILHIEICTRRSLKSWLPKNAREGYKTKMVLAYCVWFTLEITHTCAQHIHREQFEYLVLFDLCH